MQWLNLFQQHRIEFELAFCDEIIMVLPDAFPLLLMAVMMMQTLVHEVQMMLPATIDSWCY